MFNRQLEYEFEFRRNGWIGEMGLGLLVYYGSLIIGKGEIFQGNRSLSLSVEFWRIYIFKGWMGSQNKSIDVVKRLIMKIKGEFQEGGRCCEEVRVENRLLDLVIRISFLILGNRSFSCEMRRKIYYDGLNRNLGVGIIQYGD